jgi:hypothetical protein
VPEPTLPRVTAADNEAALVARYVEGLAGIDPQAPYHLLPNSLRAIESSVRSAGGLLGLSEFRAMVLREIACEESRFVSHFRSTGEVDLLILRSLRRIRGRCNNAADGHYARYDDQYLKDLAICRRVLFPAGARLVQPNAGFPRNIIARGGLHQSLRFLALLTSLGSNKPVFQVHVHPDELDDFHEAGWRRTLGCLARTLIQNPQTRAVYGSSWFYDPALAATSPRLTYIYSTAEQAGGRFFVLGPDSSGDAFVRSPTRRRLAEAGKYVPMSWAVIWPRQELIRRAANW